jgi:uncharacterized protein
MHLIENKEEQSNIVNSVNEKHISVNNDSIAESCIISNNNLMIGLNVNCIEELNSSHIEFLLSSNPELVIIGSGIDHVFPDIDLLNPIAKNNIGFEVMNNKSAARTYNVLTTEERKVSCLLIINNS